MATGILGKKDKAVKGAAAVIEFSSNNVRMIIAERAALRPAGAKEDGGIRILEFLERPLSIGKDTFTTGVLGFDKVAAACVIVKNFLKAAAGYGVALRDVRLIATSALREAHNKNYILDQVRLKTGVAIHILDSQEEKLNIFKMSSMLLLNKNKTEGDPNKDEPALLVFVGSGNVGFSVVEGGRIPFYQNIRIGPLRISGLFDELSRNSKEYHVVVDEYVNTYLNKEDIQLPGKITQLYLSGGDINAVKHLCGTEREGGIYRIEKSDFVGLYERVKDSSTDRISGDLKIPLYRAKMLIPALTIIGNFFALTGLKSADALPAYLNESIMYRVLYPNQAKETDKAFYRNTLLCTKSIAARYDVHEAHCEKVESFAMKIYDKIRKLHGMGVRERALLQCAAHLHDCGKFIGPTGHAENSYNIVSNLDILGFDDQEMRILSVICLLHSTAPPETNNGFRYMPNDEKTITAKLSAILRIADALDRSGSQKIKDIEVVMDDDELVIKAVTNSNIDLEKWSFTEKGRFFGEVFGIKATLRVAGKK